MRKLLAKKRIPRPLRHLQKELVSHLSKNQAKKYAGQFRAAFKPDRDYSHIPGQLILRMLVDDQFGLRPYAHGKVLGILDKFVTLIERERAGKIVSRRRWRKIAEAAQSTDSRELLAAHPEIKTDHGVPITDWPVSLAVSKAAIAMAWKDEPYTGSYLEIVLYFHRIEIHLAAAGTIRYESKLRECRWHPINQDTIRWQRHMLLEILSHAPSRKLS